MSFRSFTVFCALSFAPLAHAYTGDVPADQEAPAAVNAAELHFRETARAHVAAQVETENLRPLALQALDSIMERAHKRLAVEGHAALARELQGEWDNTYRKAFAGSYDMGDHAPFSQWIADWYAKVEDVLGVSVCEFMHLRDVFVFNYGWPVVVDPNFDTNWCAETIEAQPEDTCKMEYNRHFSGTKWQRDADPFAKPVTHWGVAPVSAWWVTFVACEIGLWGSDGTFLCSPAATFVEIATARYIAPPVAAKIWERNNGDTIQ